MNPTGPNQNQGPGSSNPCFPLKLVVVSVVRCDNGDPITIFTASDPQGKFLPVNGQTNRFFICCSPGYKFRVAASGMVSKDVTIVQKDIDTGFLTVCLDALPPAPNPCAHICCFSFSPLGRAAFGLHDAEEGEMLGFAPTLRQFRDSVAGTEVGRSLVDLYYDERFAGPVADALTKNPILALRLSVLLLDLWPLIRSFTPRESMDVCDRPGIPGLQDPKVVLTKGPAQKVLTFLDDLAKVVPAEVQESFTKIVAVVRDAVGHNAGTIVHSILQRK